MNWVVSSVATAPVNRIAAIVARFSRFYVLFLFAGFQAPLLFGVLQKVRHSWVAVLAATVNPSIAARFFRVLRTFLFAVVFSLLAFCVLIFC